MQYFEMLPKVIKVEKNGTSTVYTNLLSRANLINDVLTNPVLFYYYDIQDGDTPEIVAHKYYGDSYRYWLVLLPNNILDPQWDWPLNNKDFNSYIENKYNQINPYATAHHYEKVISQYENYSQITTENIIEIDEDTYNNLSPSTTSYTFPSGTTTVTISKRIISMYDYELQKNEAKRNIKILKKDFAFEAEKELHDLML